MPFAVRPCSSAPLPPAVDSENAEKKNAERRLAAFARSDAKPLVKARRAS